MTKHERCTREYKNCTRIWDICTRAYKAYLSVPECTWVYQGCTRVTAMSYQTISNVIPKHTSNTRVCLSLLWYVRSTNNLKGITNDIRICIADTKTYKLSLDISSNHVDIPEWYSFDPGEWEWLYQTALEIGEPLIYPIFCIILKKFFKSRLLKLLFHDIN